MEKFSFSKLATPRNLALAGTMLLNACATAPQNEQDTTQGQTPQIEEAPLSQRAFESLPFVPKRVTLATPEEFQKMGVAQRVNELLSHIDSKCFYIPQNAFESDKQTIEHFRCPNKFSEFIATIITGDIRTQLSWNLKELIYREKRVALGGVEYPTGSALSEVPQIYQTWNSWGQNPWEAGNKMAATLIMESPKKEYFSGTWHNFKTLFQQSSDLNEQRAALNAHYSALSQRRTEIDTAQTTKKEIEDLDTEIIATEILIRHNEARKADPRLSVMTMDQAMQQAQQQSAKTSGRPTLDIPLDPPVDTRGQATVPKYQPQPIYTEPKVRYENQPTTQPMQPVQPNWLGERKKSGFNPDQNNTRPSSPVRQQTLPPVPGSLQ